MTLTARAVAAIVGGWLSGDGEREVDGVAAPAAAGPRHLVFADSPKGLTAALASRAGVIIAGPFAKGSAGDATLVLCEQPRLAFARAARRLHPPRRPPAGVHPSAVVHPSVRLGEGVSIGPRAVLDEGAEIGDRVAIGAGAHLGAGVTVACDADIRSNVVLYPGVAIGARVVVHAGSVLGADGFGYARDRVTGRYEATPQIGCLVVEDDVEIGALCTIDRGALGETRIRRGTKLDNQVHVAHNVEIGEDVVIAGQAGIAGSARIGNGVVIAGQAGVSDHARLEPGVRLGAQAAVATGKVVRGWGEVFVGMPARPLRRYLRELAVLARLARR